MEDNIRCDYLIITDGKDITQKTGHIINDTLRTLTSQPKVLVRSIHDQGKQKDKIKCKKVMFLLLARVSFFQLLLNWLNALPGITNWNKQVLVLIQEQDTEIGDRSDIDRVLSEIYKEKEMEMIRWISSFNDISSWWSFIIKFLFKVKRFGNDDILYNLVFAVPEMKDSKTARTLSDIFLSFKLKESDASEYIVKVIDGTQQQSMTDNHAGINIDDKSDHRAISIAMLAVLTDLKVLKAKQTKQITRTVRKRTKLCNRVLTSLLNILYTIMFVLTCLLNLPFFAICLPFTCCLTFFNIPFAMILLCLCTGQCGEIRTWKHVLVQNTFALVIFGELAALLAPFYSRLSIVIAIYAFVWPILIHDLFFKIGLEFGVVSIPLSVWGKINFGLLGILYRNFGTIREQTCLRKIKPILNGLFAFIHIPVIILYCFLFLTMLKACTNQTKNLIFFFVFYTNFALAIVFGIAGVILLLSKTYIAAIITIIISLYIFFFLCVLHTYCWVEHDLEYGILSSQCDVVDECLDFYCYR